MKFSVSSRAFFPFQCRLPENFVHLGSALSTSFRITGCQATSAGPLPPAEVEVVSVVQRMPQLWIMVATLAGYFTHQIQPQVTGYSVRPTYKEGCSSRTGANPFPDRYSPFQCSARSSHGTLAQAQRIGTRNSNVGPRPLGTRSGHRSEPVGTMNVHATLASASVKSARRK